jgi:hypothetical protein
MTSITVAVKRQLTLTTLLLVVGCSGCVKPMLSSNQTPIEAPVLLHPTMPHSLAVTTCSLNNRPIVLIDSAVWHSEQREMVLVHEQVHVQRALAYRGGCWPFMYRYKSDSAFKSRIELEAYCAWGRWLMERDREPMALWARIDSLMQTKYAAKVPNCLYEGWPQ